MPRVVIKEYDNTTSGSSAAESFSVVVPGFVSDKYVSSVFDENGVYECSSQSDFEANVGKVSAQQTGAIEAKGPTIYATILGSGITEEFFDLHNIYSRTENTEATSVGKLRSLENEKYYDYTKVASFSSIVAGTTYYLIQDGEEGVDAQDAIEIKHYGNQIAYLLLGLGYTVLYVKMDSATDLVDEDFWAPLKDRSIYNFRYLVSGLRDNVTEANIDIADVNKLMIDVAANNNAAADNDTSGRGDCFALLDIPESTYVGKTATAAVTAIRDEAAITSQYAAYFAPSVTYSSAISDDDYEGNVTLPASFHYLACAVRAFVNYPEWYAVSGYTRGISDLTVAGTAIKFGDAAVNKLQPRSGNNVPAVNLVVSLNGSYYIWGNRTAYAIAADDDDTLIASHFLNIRQLCCTIKQNIYYTCKHLMFDPNSDMLWLNFCNSIASTLDDMKANQGIKDYRFERKTTSKKAKLFAAIRIVPIEAVEDFEIGVVLEDSIDETTVSIQELN